MILERRTRGQPLLALVLILGGWIGARGYAWEGAIYAREEAGGRVDAQAAASGHPAHAAGLLQPRREAPEARLATAVPAWAAAPRAEAPFQLLPSTPPLAAPAPLMAQPFDLPPAPPAPATPAAATPAPNRVLTAAGHQSLWLAATALLPLPPLGLRSPETAGSVAARPAAPLPRWSGDAWLLLRPNATTVSPGPRVGTYGASQVGAVLRYRIDRIDPHRPSLYVRAASALNGTREQEAALGLSARPLAHVPVIAMAEGRLVRSGGGVRLKPAVALVTELPPKRLPFGFTGEAYVQAGWIGGRSPTAFVDGLARAERPVLDPAEGFSLRAGAGAWAAKQRGASRVDVGPVASLNLRLSNTASARVEADWRWRVAGRSRPDSGPALTISTGF